MTTPPHGKHLEPRAGEETARGIYDPSRSVIPRTLNWGASLQVLAALLWLPQAALLAYGVGQLVDIGFTSTIYYLAIGIFLIGCSRSLLDGWGSAIAYDAARRELTLLREQAIETLSKHSPFDKERPTSGESASILGEQAETVVPYLSRFVPVRFRVVAVPLVILAIVTWFSWISGLVLLVAAPLIPIFMALIGWRAQAASEKQLVALGDMNGFLLDRLRGLSTIRSFHAVDSTARELRKNAETLREKTMIVLRIAFLSSAVLEFFAAIGVAMVAVYIGFHFLGQLDFGAWGNKLTLAEGLFILLLAPTFFEPLRELSAVWHDRASGEAAIKALKQLAQNTAPIVGSLETKNSADTSPSIELDNIDFAYPNAQKTFSNLSLEIGGGEHVALLAPSGHGKSTLLALIAGLIAPQSGQIKIGGVALNSETASRFRSKMRWVGQKPHIFFGSARHNITLGRDAQHGDIATIIDQMALGHVVGVTGNGVIGENGRGLSGGETLRLALARIALDQDAQIILVDEPTAHLDRHTARQITDTLLDLAKGKTLIVSTHDEELARQMDRIIRIDGFCDAANQLHKRAAE